MKRRRTGAMLLSASVAGALGLVSFATSVGAFDLGRTFGRSAQPTPASAPTIIAKAAPEETRRETRIKLRAGESLAGALQRVGVAADDAQGAAEALKPAQVRAGQTVQALLQDMSIQEGAGARLVSLTVQDGPAVALRASRGPDGRFVSTRTEEAVSAELEVATGQVNGSLYASAARAANVHVAGGAVAVLAKSVDFSRDLAPQNPFRLVYSQRRTESGRTVGRPDLLYAAVEVKGRDAVLYSYRRRGAAAAEWFDSKGRNTNGVLLRTPVDGARITSGYGMRRHPISGYTKLHRGLDFGAPTGTPVYAAGDGVVVEARRWGGYGNWLRIRHGQGWDTGYGHLSAYARGLKPGDRVTQGQVVAYVGSTGASTGPHLHYETWLNGQRRSPSDARTTQLTVLAGADLAAFRRQKARIDAALASAPSTPAPSALAAAAATTPRRS